MLLFLYGEDTYRLRKKLKEIIDKFIRDWDKSGLNLSKFDGAKIDFDALSQALGAAPFMAKKRMVVIENLLSSSKKKLPEGLDDALLKNSEDTIIVLSEEVSAKDLLRSPFFKRLEKNKYNYVFEPLRVLELERWIKKEALARGIGFTPPMLASFTKTIGNDLWRAASELDKIASYIRGGKSSRRLTAQNFEKLVSAKTEQNIFGLIDAIGNRDEKTAYKKLAGEIAAGSNELYILTMLIRQFEFLLKTKELSENKKIGKDEIARELDAHPFKVQKALVQIKKFSAPNLRRLLAELIKIDQKIKTGYAKPDLLLDLFLSKI